MISLIPLLKLGQGVDKVWIIVNNVCIGGSPQRFVEFTSRTSLSTLCC